MKSLRNILIASSSADFRRQLLNNLVTVPVLFAEALGGADALAKLAQGDFQTLMLDSKLADLDSQELLITVESLHPGVDVILMDRQAQPIALSIRASHHLGTQLVFKELQDREHFLQSPAAAVDETATCFMPAFAGSPLKVSDHERPLPGLIGFAPQMLTVARKVRLVASRDTNILITGETGTGKEIVARALHQMSGRASHPFVVLNCAAIPETLLESELFGFTRGAFTGALQSRIGNLQAADGGTLFLDEIGELPFSMQVKLLRFLQDGEIRRLGGLHVVRVDARVVAATNADLASRIRNHTFRSDLYFRLAVFPIEMPSLRDRKQDLLPLVSYFLDRYCNATKGLKHLSRASWQALEAYEWPGNVRELQHVVERAVILSENETLLQPEHLMLASPLALPAIQHQ